MIEEFSKFNADKQFKAAASINKKNNKAGVFSFFKAFNIPEVQNLN
jgi:hypothetical protein